MNYCHCFRYVPFFSPIQNICSPKRLLVHLPWCGGIWVWGEIRSKTQVLPSKKLLVCLRWCNIYVNKCKEICQGRWYHKWCKQTMCDFRDLFSSLMNEQASRKRWLLSWNFQKREIRIKDIPIRMMEIQAINQKIYIGLFRESWATAFG